MGGAPRREASRAVRARARPDGTPGQPDGAAERGGPSSPCERLHRERVRGTLGGGAAPGRPTPL